jgi:hypothetical protein
MSRRRRQTAHDVKRRLMHKLDALLSSDAERVLLDLREYVIARQFLDGVSFDTLARSETLGNAEWTRARIEQAVRTRAKVRSPKS